MQRTASFGGVFSIDAVPEDSMRRHQHPAIFTLYDARVPRLSN